MIIRYLLRRYVKSGFLHLNIIRSDKTACTDPLLANCKRIFHGYNVAQVFYGVKSHAIFIYGIKIKGEFLRFYKDSIKDHRAPSALRKGNAKEEQSEQIKVINRKFMIKD